MANPFSAAWDAAVNIAMPIWQQDKAEGMQDHAQNFSASQAAENRAFQERMRSTQYQTAVGDMRAAGLNPMLAYGQGGAGTPAGNAATSPGGTAARGYPSNLTANLQSAAQIDLMEKQSANIEAQTDREKATADEIRARTPTHEVNIAKMRQEINESIERIQDIQQRVRTGASSAAHMDQMAENLRAALPQIQASTNQLQSLARLNDAQAIERLTASGLNEAHAKEILQRVRQDLPALERQLMDLHRIAEQMQQPGRMADEAAKDSLIGQIGAYLKALVPLQGVMGAIPLGRIRGSTTAPKYVPRHGDYAPGQGPNR